ncbi:MAG: flavodoxin domain-containing protein [Actinomycetaceae bacterium]|nr:flavodoxin domain-containing protein [Actinomycetaceae bacterium]
MKILAVWASRHGATKEVAETIATELREAGIDLDLKEAGEVGDISEYDGFVLGSSVYMTQWEDSMRRFIKQNQAELFEKELWAFSVGLSGVQTGVAKDPVRVGPVLLRIEPRDHKTFAGRLQPSELSLRERSIARLGGAVEGDFRDWEEIRTWAKQVADDIKSLEG